MKKLILVIFAGWFALAAGCTTIVSKAMKVSPGDHVQMIEEKNVMMPMRDGVKLAIDIYRPKKPGKYPAILCRIPYGSDGQMYAILAKFFVRHGYIFLMQDTRGTFSSEGTYFPLVFEYDDGHDTVEWITKQPWYNGKLGTWGGSYFGYTQWEEAPDDPAVTAMNPLYTSGTMKSVIFRGGATEYATFVPWNADMAEAWNKKNGLPALAKVNLLAGGFFNEPIRDGVTLDVKAIVSDPHASEKGMDTWSKHPGDIADIPQLNFDKYYTHVSAPSLLLAGWYDMFNGPQINDFQRIRAEGIGDARKTRIIIGPWTHGAPGFPPNKLFKEKLLDGIAIFGSGMIGWYDHWLRGIDNGADKAAAVKIFVMGENKWRDENEWPLARTKWSDFYLHSSGGANTGRGNGKLEINVPKDEPADKFAFDPANPAPTLGGAFLPSDTEKAGAFDQALAEKRGDVLVYVTEPLAGAVEVTGPVKMVLYATSDAKDTDFTAKLVDVWPDGKVYNLCDGIIRARYRDGYKHPTAIEPGKVYKYEIDMWTTSNLFKSGHRIGVEISSSNFPQFDRNTNCAGEGGPQCRKVAHQVILHDAANPSHLVLPVIPR